jgi:hypothetical protein
VISLLLTFLVLLGLLTYWNKRPVRLKSVTIPQESILLSKELAMRLSQTEIPAYVLTYGTVLSCPPF